MHGHGRKVLIISVTKLSSPFIACSATKCGPKTPHAIHLSSQAAPLLHPFANSLLLTRLIRNPEIIASFHPRPLFGVQSPWNLVSSHLSISLSLSLDPAVWPNPNTTSSCLECNRSSAKLNPPHTTILHFWSSEVVKALGILPAGRDCPDKR